jgi:hypothetical protein
MIQTKSFRPLGRLVAITTLSVLTFRGSVHFPQISKDLPTEIKAELAKSPVPPPSNQQVGIDIDRFIGHPSQSPVITMRTILRYGDPYKPGDPGAVLENRKDLTAGTVLSHRQSPLADE